MATAGRPRVTFIEQNAPIDEYGRALYAVEGCGGKAVPPELLSLRG